MHSAHINLLDQVHTIGEKFVQSEACFQELHARPNQFHELLPFVIDVLLPFGHFLSVYCSCISYQSR